MKKYKQLVPYHNYNIFLNKPTGVKDSAFSKHPTAWELKVRTFGSSELPNSMIRDQIENLDEKV